MKKLVPAHVTQLLKAIGCGNHEELGMLMSEIYDDLKQVARNLMRRERPDHTLQPTALVHELIVKIRRGKLPEFDSLAGFRTWCARVMLNILINHGIAHKSHAALNSGLQAVVVPPTPVFEDLHKALEKLAAMGDSGKRQSEVVIRRFFGGLSIDETAKDLGISHGTVERDWSFARAWLRREMTERLN